MSQDRHDAKGITSGIERCEHESQLFADINHAASETWSALIFGWRRSRRPNYRQDIGALLGALRLDESCRELLDAPDLVLLPTTNYERYELYAGALVVRDSLPITPNERGGLQQTVERFDFDTKGWASPPPHAHLELIDEWRAWLRHDGSARAPVGSVLHGQASLLAAASYRLMIALNPDRQVDLHSEVDTLVNPMPAQSASRCFEHHVQRAR